jgi:hypothetical protein
VVTAAIGFLSVVYAQRRIARNSLEDREHREKIAREERQHRDFLAKRELENEREHRRTTFIHAIAG